MREIRRALRPRIDINPAMLVPIKPLDQATTSDSWWDAFVMFDGQQFRRRELSDHHAIIAEVGLSESVPEGVRQQFENARNVYLYAFFAHRLLMVADLHAYISVEFALREKAVACGVKAPEWWGMSRLITRAIKERWIVDDGFGIFRRNEAARREQMERWSQINPKFRYEPPADAQAYCRNLAESFPSLRNALAHGSDMLYPSVIGTFEIAADLIGQLFSAASE